MPSSPKKAARMAKEAYEEGRRVERERCAKLVPTNWLDPLLTGKEVARPPLTGRSIEALLRGIQDRIRANSSSTETKP